MTEESKEMLSEEQELNLVHKKERKELLGIYH